MSNNIKLRDETIKQVRALLISAREGLTVREIESDYQNIIGEQLPYRKLGYSCAEDLFKEWPDVVQVTFRRGQMILIGVADESTKNMQRLVARQKSPRKKSLLMPGGRAVLNNGRTRSQRPPAKFTTPHMLRSQVKELLAAHPSGLSGSSLNTAFSRRFGTGLNYQKYGFGSVVEFLGSMRDIVEMKDVRGGGFRLHLVNSHNNNYQPAGTEDNEVEPLVCDGAGIDEDAVPQQIKHNIKKVLARRPKGVFAARFPIEYRELHGRELPFSDLGFNSVVELASSIADIVTIERPSPQGDWLLFDAEHKATEGKAKSTVSQASQGSVESLSRTRYDKNETIKEKVRQVLGAHPEGLYLSSFPEIFQTLTGEELNVQDYGFSTTEDFLHDLPSVVKLEYVGRGQLLVHGVNDGREPRHDMLPGLHAKEEHPIKGGFTKNIPQDAVGPGSSYPAFKISYKSGEYFEVFVSNISNPSRFWLQIAGKNTTVALEELMDRLEEVYDSSMGDTYIMPETLVAIGQVCVAIFPEDENWHRAVIAGIPNMDFVEVQFVDYGNSCCVPRASLRMLKNRFLKLPAQALECRLSNIVPVDQEGWLVATRDRMLSLCANRPLVALLTSQKCNELSVCLCDTSSDTDIHINDLLVSEGYARFAPDDSMQQIQGGDRSFICYSAIIFQTNSDALLLKAAQDVAHNQTLENQQVKQSAMVVEYNNGKVFFGGYI